MNQTRDLWRYNRLVTTSPGLLYLFKSHSHSLRVKSTYHISCILYVHLEVTDGPSKAQAACRCATTKAVRADIRTPLLTDCLLINITIMRHVYGGLKYVRIYLTLEIFVV